MTYLFSPKDHDNGLEKIYFLNLELQLVTEVANMEKCVVVVQLVWDE